jgi:predicted nucleotidyltransferase
LVKYKGKIYTIRRLAEDAGVSHPEASATLQELEKFGIVEIQPVGRAHQISLNEKSYVLGKIIMPLLKAEQKTLDEVVLILRDHFNTKKIISAVIFGSVAKREEKDDSDMDVFIVSNDRNHALSLIANAGQKIFAKFHSDISPLVFSESEFKSKKKGNAQLVRSILDDHIMICGKELGDI